MFLDISKAFDKIWHKDLLYTLESMGISGNPLNLMESFLSERYQRVPLMDNHLNGLVLMLRLLRTQFWVLFFFLIYINDLPEGITSNIKLISHQNTFSQLFIA